MPTRTLSELGIDPDAVEDALSRDLTFPASWYSDPAVYEFELDTIFGRSWQYVGALDKLQKPGDRIVSQVGRIPVVAVRDLDGALRGFVNVCRHRAYPVAAGDGNSKTLQCGYHAWTYGLDGRLRKAPRSEHEPEFDTSDLGLLPVSVDTWDRFVFVNPDPCAAPFRETYPEFEALAIERGLDFAGYRFHGHYSYEIAANWKAYVENSDECYHCPTIHTHSFSEAFVSKLDVYEYVDGTRVLGQFTDYHAKAASHGHVPREGERRFRYVHLWPGTFLIQDDHVAFPAVVVPTGPESCRLESDMYVHPDSSPELVREWAGMWNATLLEDVEAVSRQQVGLRSRAVPHGRLMPASESAISRFHRMVWEAFAEALGEA
jgi:phenylpropionate dioxygenase-like ring-hydroxylating dioxygenase large terminal subunit